MSECLLWVFLMSEVPLYWWWRVWPESEREEALDPLIGPVLHDYHLPS